MSDPRLPVRQGQRLNIAASQINALNQMMRVGGGFSGGNQAAFEPGRNVVLARNDSGYEVDQWGVMSITGIVINPSAGDRHRASFGQMPCLIGGTPASGNGARHRWMIAAEPIKNGKIGRAIVSGVAQVKVDMLDASHFMADPYPGSRVLRSGSGSAQIIWVEPGTGERWALIRFGRAGDALRLCKTSAAFPKNTAASLQVHENGEALAETPTAGVTVFTHNKYADIGANKFVSVARHGNSYWYVVAAEC